MDFNIFAIGKYNNEPSEKFFEYFGINKNFKSYNIFDSTQYIWFADNEEVLPHGKKKNCVITQKDNREGGGFEEVIFKENFSVAIEKTDDGHCFCYILNNDKYNKFSADVDLDEWFDC